MRNILLVILFIGLLLLTNVFAQDSTVANEEGYQGDESYNVTYYDELNNDLALEIGLMVIRDITSVSQDLNPDLNEVELSLEDSVTANGDKLSKQQASELLVKIRKDASDIYISQIGFNGETDEWRVEYSTNESLFLVIFLNKNNSLITRFNFPGLDIKS